MHGTSSNGFIRLYGRLGGIPLGEMPLGDDSREPSRPLDVSLLTYTSIGRITAGIEESKAFL